MILHANTLPPGAPSIIEIITHNISKALLHSYDTLLQKTPRASSSRTVLPIVTPFQKEDTFPSQYKIVGISLKMTHNYTTSGPTTPSLPTKKQNPSRTS